jgi:flagellar protein FlbT
VPLNIELKPHEKIFINGAVIANGPDRTQISLLNEAAILREKDILTEHKADTPCKRIYLLVQLMYMDPANLARYLTSYEELASDVINAAPSLTPMLATIDAELTEGRVYPALRSAKRLIDYEQELLDHARQSP